MKTIKLITVILLVQLMILSSCSKDISTKPNIDNQLSDQARNDVGAVVAGRVTTPGIVYVPLNISLVGNTKAYSYVWTKSVDLDQDSAMDFSFNLGIAWSRGADFYQFTTSINALQTGGGTLSVWAPTALSGMPSAWVSNAMAIGTTVDSSKTTYANPSLPSTYAYSFYFGARRGGTIIGKGDKYVGIRFVSGGQTYYGWVRINIPANSRTFNILDAAFQNIPGAPIAIGAKQ